MPDIREQPCHFSVKSGTVSTVQREPQKELDARLKLTLPLIQISVLMTRLLTVNQVMNMRRKCLEISVIIISLCGYTGYIRNLYERGDMCRLI